MMYLGTGNIAINFVQTSTGTCTADVYFVKLCSYTLYLVSNLIPLIMYSNYVYHIKYASQLLVYVTEHVCNR